MGTNQLSCAPSPAMAVGLRRSAVGSAVPFGLQRCQPDNNLEDQIPLRERNPIL